MSISDLSEKLGVSRVAIYHLFKGNYSREMLKNVSKVLNIPVHVLLTPYEQNEGTPAMKLLSAYEAAPKNVQQGVNSILGISSKGSVFSSKKRSVLMFSPGGSCKELISFLTKTDSHFFCLSTLASLIEILKDHKFDLIILDGRLQSVESLITKLSKKYSLKLPPILVLSSSSKKVITSKTANVHYMPKPVNNIELQKQFEKMVSNA